MSRFTVVSTEYLLFAEYDDESAMPQSDAPATEEEINQLTGETGRWMPSVDEWVLMAAIAGLVLIVEALMR